MICWAVTSHAGKFEAIINKVKEIKSTVGIKGFVKTEVTGEKFRGFAQIFSKLTPHTQV